MPVTKDNSSRELTADEVREQFIRAIWSRVDYWDTVELPTKNQRERLRGLAFEILVILDGATDLPVFIVAPSPHESDKAFHQEHGTNWYPENDDASVNCNIAVEALHEEFSAMGDPAARRA